MPANGAVKNLNSLFLRKQISAESESLRIESNLLKISKIFFPFEKYQNTQKEHHESFQKYNYYGHVIGPFNQVPRLSNIPTIMATITQQA